MHIAKSDIESKLLILYLVDKMDLPAISRSQITDFVIEKELMDHFTLEENLSYLLTKDFLDSDCINSEDESSTRYTITDFGINQLEQLLDHISSPVRQIVRQYVIDNRGKLKKGFEKTASYFQSPDGDGFIVKCGVYDDKRSSLLMEVSISVITREQAKAVALNWNNNYSALYSRILNALTEGEIL